MKIEVYTTYHKTFEASSIEEAEKLAMDDLDKMNGLGNEWIWSEDVDNSFRVED